MEKIQFKLYNPKEDTIKSIPNVPGNYIVALKDGAELPNIGFPVEYHYQNDLKIIYTGVSSKLRTRDIKVHFKGRADCSTLRKSLGCLFGFELINRRVVKSNTKLRVITGFSKKNECFLSEWMSVNTLLFYCENNDYLDLERKLIYELNPPLNLDKNYNRINEHFRQELKNRRKTPLTCKLSIYNIDKNNKSNKYKAFWEKYIPEFICLVKGENSSINVHSEKLKEIGNRIKTGYDFEIVINKSEIKPKSKNSVAKNLCKVLLENDKFMHQIKGLNLIISSKNFIITLKLL